MDRESVKTHQQIEFFLLHSLVVDELRVLKRARRITPASKSHYTMNQRSAIIGRLFRSFLMKVFPASMFAVSKRAYRQEFEIKIADNAVRDLLRRAKDILPMMYQSLQPEAGEIGLLRFDFPSCLTFRIGGYVRRNRWANRNGCEPHEVGIGRYCPAAKAALSWKRRFDSAVKEAKALEEEVGPPAPVMNHAQEQLDAVLRAAAEAGRL